MAQRHTVAMLLLHGDSPRDEQAHDRLAAALPFWPLGLPGWHDPVVALGMRDDEGELLTVWRRSGPTTVRVPLDAHTGRELDLEIVFPKGLPTRATWDAAAGELVVELPDEPAARTLRLRRA